MPQEWSKKSTLKSDFAEAKRQVGVIMRGNVPVNSGDPARSYRTNVAHQAFLKSLDDNNNSRGSKRAAAPDARAIARARMVAEGKERRKKFEKEKGKRVAKRRKLLLNIKDSS